MMPPDPDRRGFTDTMTQWPPWRSLHGLLRTTRSPGFMLFSVSGIDQQVSIREQYTATLELRAVIGLTELTGPDANHWITHM